MGMRARATNFPFSSASKNDERLGPMGTSAGAGGCVH